MRSLLIYILLSLLSCSSAEEPRALIFIDSNAFFESCEVQSCQLILDFPCQLITEENRRIFHRSIYSLTPHLTLDIMFSHQDISEGLTDFPDDRLPARIDTLALNEANGTFKGKAADQYFLFSKAIDFGYVYFLFDFGGMKGEKREEVIEDYLQRMVFKSDYLPPTPAFSAMDAPLPLANGIAISGKQQTGRTTIYALTDSSAPGGEQCSEIYLYYYQLLNPAPDFLRSGDQIVIYPAVKSSNVKALAEPLLRMIFRENTSSTESNFGQNAFDCIDYQD